MSYYYLYIIYRFLLCNFMIVILLSYNIYIYIYIYIPQLQTYQTVNMNIYTNAIFL
jgi:hypothetical protein